MRIPNKFNGYMSDGRRLYPDPATSAIMAQALASSAGTAAAGTAAATTAAAAAAPTLATAAATELGTTAALEAGKQAAVKAGTDVMAQQAAQQVANQGVQQVAQAGVKEGIMQGAQQTAQGSGELLKGLDAAKFDAVTGQAGMPTNAFPGNIVPSPAPAVPPASPPGVPNAPYELTSKAVPDIATKPIDQIASTSLPQPSLPSTNIADGANVAKDVVGNPSLKVGPEQLATKTPPNALERGFSAAKQMAGDASKFAKENPLLTTGGIMLAQNMMQPSYSAPAKKKYSGSSDSGDFKYRGPSAGEYTPIFTPTPYAVGGSVEDMSAENAIGGNMMYPQSQMNTPMYSNSMMSRPMPTNVIQSGIDAPVGSYSGQPNYAAGGITGSGALDLHVPFDFNDTNSTNGYSAAGGQQIGTSQTPTVTQSDAAANTQSALGNMASVYTDSQGYAEGGKLSAFERMMKEEEARKKKEDAQARADLEEGKSVASKTRPYSRTQSTNSPYAAAIKEFQALNKKYGIPVAAPAKTNVDLMGDQDQIEYAANGGIMHGLGGYSDGGRLLKGPGDGVSDSIPAVIGNKQPARLADGEFVIPARIVSELGNGSTEAGARKLYAMMERVQKQRRKTVGKGKVAVNSKADKHLPA